MTWTPVIPAAWIVVLACAGIALCVMRRRRPAGAIALRVASLALIGLLVASPSRIEERAGSERRASVLVMADASSSMGLLAPGASGRWSARSLGALRDRGEVRVVDHAGVATGEGRVDRAEASPLRATLERELAASTPDHLVLVTDGIDTTGRSLADLDTGGAVVHALALDGVPVVPDARVSASPASPLAYTGQATELVVRVTQTGLDGRATQLRVEQEGRVVDERTVRLAPGVTEVRVAINPTLAEGVTRSTLAYTARLEPLVGEADEQNNGSVALVRVSAEPIRVLVLEGQPHWDTRFFVRALRADGQVEVTSASTLDDRFRAGTRTPRVRVTRSGHAGGGDDGGAIALPASVDGFARYDVIAIGRGIEQFVPGLDAELLRDAVMERGVSVLFFRGDPVVSGAPEAVRTGRVLGALLDAPIERALDPGVVRRAGSGVVMTVASSPGFREALVAPGGASSRERGAFARRWSRVARTLATGSGVAPGARVWIEATPTSAPPRAPRTLLVRARTGADALPETVTLVGPDGVPRSVALSADPGSALVRRASVAPSAEGVWTVRDDGGRVSRFVVMEDRLERTLLTPATGATTALAERTGGVVLRVDDGPEAVARAIERASALTRGPAETVVVWDRWWVALAVVMLLLIEWVWRRGAAS